MTAAADRAELRVPYAEIERTLTEILLGLGFEARRAALAARLFAEASRDGVYSHGLNRFPRFVEMVREGIVNVSAEPRLVTAGGAIERWDGDFGPGNLNAHACMARAIELSRDHGIGCVALRNTNHWMRGGSYGWQAADAGVIGICWTNTMPNLPPWGAKDARLGNNPLIIAVPRASGSVVLDIAMSQFSFGGLESYRRRGEQLPVPGGYGPDGELTTDPAAIEESGRVLPIGYWKGSGLALVLDLVATLLSEGRPTYRIAPDLSRETGISQVFLAIDPSRLPSRGNRDTVVDEVLANFHGDGDGDDVVRHPGERTLDTRRRNLHDGVPVDPEIWKRVLDMK